MKIQVGESILQIPEKKYAKNTKTYISLLLNLINKGLDNPLFQLHVLSIIHTVRSFKDLITSSSQVLNPEIMIDVLKSIPPELLGKFMQEAEITNETIEDFLNNMNKEQ